jgi:hypothetical protein
MLKFLLLSMLVTSPAWAISEKEICASIQKMGEAEWEAKFKEASATAFESQLDEVQLLGDEFLNSLSPSDEALLEGVQKKLTDGGRVMDFLFDERVSPMTDELEEKGIVREKIVLLKKGMGRVSLEADKNSVAAEFCIKSKPHGPPHVCESIELTFGSLAELKLMWNDKIHHVAGYPVGTKENYARSRLPKSCRDAHKASNVSGRAVDDNGSAKNVVTYTFDPLVITAAREPSGGSLKPARRSDNRQAPSRAD